MTHPLPPLKDRLIPWYFVAFFVFVAIVNAAMVTLAVRTQPAIVTDHPYEKGLAYNKVVAAEAEQEKRGWSGKIEFDEKTHILSFSLVDKTGKTIEPQRVYAEITRPVFSASAPQGMDFTIELAKSGQQGFATKIEFPKPGVWQLRIFAEAEGKKYQKAKRIIAE